MVKQSGKVVLKGTFTSGLNRLPFVSHPPLPAPIVTSSRRMSMHERRAVLERFREEGWLTADLDATPRWIAKRGDAIGWGFTREAAIADLDRQQ